MSSHIIKIFMTKETLKTYLPNDLSTTWHETFSISEVSAVNIKKIVSNLHDHKNVSLKLITATDERETNGCFKVWYIFDVPGEDFFVIFYIQLKNTEEFPSLVSVFPEAGNYERKIQTFFGLTPIGHPDLRPIILHENWPTDIFPLRKDFHWKTQCPPADNKAYQFHGVDGEGIYEIPVGPIHAGIIEPGHFRFSVAGEEIVLLEARLGFVHKGIEKLFECLSLDRMVHLSEKISGDSSFSHSLAFCQTVEQLGNISLTKRALYLRVIYAELERLANHFGDIGAIMIDTGFNFGGAQGARLREMIMQINERLTGSRFLRGVNFVGGVSKDIENKEKKKLFVDLENINKDFLEIIEIAENSASLLNRLKGTGVLSYEIAQKHGVVGVAAKAVGISSDVRFSHPYVAYKELGFDEIVREKNGDVYARFMVRIREAHASIKIIQHALETLPKESLHVQNLHISLQKNACAVSVVEGWRGEILYFITTNEHGLISRVAPRDPSFINWAVLGDAGLGNVVPDFPLINKSFNLSYSGNDL